MFVTDLGGGIVTVSVPYTLPPNVKATQAVPYLVTDDGRLELVTGKYDSGNKQIVLKLRHLSPYVFKTNTAVYEVTSGWYDADSFDFTVRRGLFDAFIADGKVAADSVISREDFIVSLLKTMGIKPQTSFAVDQFSDVNGENAGYLRTARELGVISGVGGNRFEPHRAATRGEQFQVIYNLVGKDLARLDETAASGKKIADFADAADVPVWLTIALSSLLDRGIIVGDGANLNVKKDFTLGEVAVLMKRLS